MLYLMKQLIIDDNLTLNHKCQVLHNRMTIQVEDWTPHNLIYARAIMIHLFFKCKLTKMLMLILLLYLLLIAFIHEFPLTQWMFNGKKNAGSLSL